MKRIAPALLTILLLWGCDNSRPDEAADVEPLPVQGELLDSAPAPSDEAPNSEVEASSPPEPDSQLASAEVSLPESTVTETAQVIAAATGVESASSAGKDEGDYKFVAFDTLTGYEYFLTPLNESSLNKEPPKDQIPKHVRALDRQKVVIEGYMVPIDVEGERIKSFILTNSMMMCCFGAMPWINEWIFVEMEGDEGAGFYNDTVIRTKGVLEVGEEIEDGMVLSLYRMKGLQVVSTGEPIPFLYGQ